MSARFHTEIRTEDGLLERAVDFDVRGCTLRGNVVRGEESASVGLIFVHGWSGYRNGPHGLIPYLARRSAREGYPSLRFDFRGRGESEGEGLETSLPGMAEDLVAASEWFADELHLRKLVYVGLCSGGNVTIGTLKRLPLAAGLVLFSVYPFSDGDAFGRDVHRTWHFARIYLHKALQGETWRRLFRGDVHLLRVLDVLFGHFVHRKRNQEKEEAGQETEEEKRSVPAAQTAKPSAAESRLQGKEAPRDHLANLRAGLPALMIYGTADPDAAAAQRYFGEYAEEKNLPVSFVTIEGANHNFSSMAWKQRLFDLTLAFLRRLDKPGKHA